MLIIVDGRDIRRNKVLHVEESETKPSFFFFKHLIKYFIEMRFFFFF